MNDLKKRNATIEDEINTVTRAVRDKQNRLDDHDTQNQRIPTINSMKEAIEDSVSAAVDAGVIHALDRDSLDPSIKDEHFLSDLSASFLRHPGTRNAITRFTRALVEQKMNDYLTDQAANAHNPQRRQSQHRRRTLNRDSTPRRSDLASFRPLVIRLQFRRRSMPPTALPEAEGQEKGRRRHRQLI